MNRAQLLIALAALQERMTARLAAIPADRTMSDDEATAQEADEKQEASVKRSLAFLDRNDARQAAEAADAAAIAAAGALPAKARVVNAPGILTKTTQAQRNGDKFKGQSVARFALALAYAHIKKRDVNAVMEERWGRTRPELVKLAQAWHRFDGPGALQRHSIRAANEIAGGGTGSGDWAHELVQLDGEFTGDFIDLLRAKTVFDSLPLTVVPANVIIKGQDGTGTAYWVGEHKPIPMSAQDYSSVSLTPLKIGALTAISIELTEDSSPDSERLVTNSLVKDSTQLLDTKFFSTDAASAGISPAGMLNGVSLGSSAGPDLNGLLADTNAQVQKFITAKNTGGLHWASRPQLARDIADFRNLMGQRIYDSLTEDGGTYDSKPFHTTDNAGSGDLLLLKPSDIYRIGDSGLSVDVSTDATLEFASDPTGAGDATPVAQSKQPVSLFQAGMIGIRLFRRINWAKRRTGAVVGVGDAAYVPQIQTA